jgi:hypothetical protein
MKPIKLLGCVVIPEVDAETILDISEYDREPVPDVSLILIVALHDILSLDIL